MIDCKLQAPPAFAYHYLTPYWRLGHPNGVMFMRRSSLLTTMLAVSLAFASAAFAQPAGSSAPAPSVVPSGVAQTPAQTAPNSSSMAAPVPMHPAAAAGSGDVSPMTASDSSFIKKASEGGLAEVQEAQLAQQKASSDQTKQFAQTMMTDHTAANQQLAQIVSAKGATAPTEPSAMQQKHLAMLQGKSGTAFDKAYVSGEVRDHEKMIKLFQAEAKSGKDTELKAFAEQTLPKLQQHLQMAQTDAAM